MTRQVWLMAMTLMVCVSLAENEKADGYVLGKLKLIAIRLKADTHRPA